ncbi:nucleotidyltransferase domain-containing protein [Nocardia abscessus]|uniref:nucleotidyltransferase domain-containing protein n=1 Tax=Nocardia abscessus TaxID=120957 RepID=UPI0024576F91|nr:nucleotidyltransferase domain-containing protein [Nocardia abscessus]
MKTPGLRNLLETNRPDQFALLEAATELFTRSDAVTDLLVRGSLARGTADRLSDVDFVVAVEDARFPQFVSALDPLIATELGGILPGWRDTIVGDMGGLGYVFLLVWADHLQQLDLYAVPASRLARVREQSICQTIFTRDPNATHAVDAETTRFVTRMARQPPDCENLLIEALVIGYLIRKRVTRGQDFIAYSEGFLFNTAVKNLIKTALAPSSSYYGWYQLHEEIGRTPLGRDCLNHLTALVTAPPIPTLASVTEGLNRVIAVAERAIPEILHTHRDAIDAYRRYMEL